MRRPLVLAAALVALVAAVVVASPRFGGRAAAAVVHGEGFSATVAGWTSWYGSYRVAGLGTAWCVDHGIAAPDGEFDYEPATLDDRPPEARQAVAWVVTRAGPSADAVTAAAVMLAVHHLMGAQYPHGPLDLGRLQTTDLAGFGGHESEVLDRARALIVDGIAAGRLKPPVALSATVGPADGVLTARVVDTAGSPVIGIPIRVGDGSTAKGITDGSGTWRAPIPIPADRSPVAVTATVPDLTLHSFAPTRRPAQRVAVPATIELTASAPLPAPTPTPARHHLTITKSGDDTAYLPVAGARFSAGGHDIDMVGASGSIELDAGHYQVAEVVAPFGYETAGPWDVDLSGGDADLDVLDHAITGSAVVHKLDALTRRPVTGARLAVRFDDDHDGRFDTAIAQWSTTENARRLDRLKPGNYQLTELEPPAGYRPAGPVAFAVEPGKAAEVMLADAPLASVTFAKQPPLPGAVFALRDTAGSEAGRCTTADDGRCRIDSDAVVAGARYCWTEVKAPTGYGVAAGACLTVGAGATPVDVVDRPLPVAISAHKTDGQSGRPLAGATYELLRGPPGGEQQRVGTATSDQDGQLHWPAQLPGSTVCIVEQTAPAGYALDPEPRCAPVEVGQPVMFALADHTLAVPVKATVSAARPTAPPARPIRPTSPPELARTGVGHLTVSALKAGMTLAVLGWILVGVSRLKRRRP